MTYVLNETQTSTLQQVLNSRTPTIINLIERAVAATSTYGRPSTVTLLIKVAQDKEDPCLIVVRAQEKIKCPKAESSDLTSWDDTQIIANYRVDIDPNQTRIAEADVAS